MDMNGLEVIIKKQGWSFFGIVSYEEAKKVLRRHALRFDSWLKAGCAADMDYLSRMREDRYFPGRRWPDFKSVVVLCAWYGIFEQTRLGRAKNRGLLARYAAGKDYHRVIRKKLAELAVWLEGQGNGVQTYLSVDSGPAADRALAEAAGLGFSGKNSMIIHPQRGSYFFIASVMTNLALPPTARPSLPNCGTCTRCTDACPTGAIVRPGVIDSRRCIAYLTIENRGGIPLELREKIGNRLFGCDICQEVCPFNRLRAKKQTVRIPELTGRFGAGESLDLREVLSLGDDEQFLARFAGTPLMRARRLGLLRNACVVAGNSGDRSLILDLQKVIDREKDPMILEHAAWAIGRLQS